MIIFSHRHCSSRSPEEKSRLINIEIGPHIEQCQEFPIEILFSVERFMRFLGLEELSALGSCCKKYALHALVLTTLLVSSMSDIVQKSKGFGSDDSKLTRHHQRAKRIRKLHPFMLIEYPLKLDKFDFSACWNVERHLDLCKTDNRYQDCMSFLFC